ncbi:hypothetical protein HQ585_15595 [candidate division KSB1 bacterium]|nr:hypothetical protein [candidate division KSB1 bacterium]
MKSNHRIILLFLVLVLCAGQLWAQMQGLHGDERYIKRGDHAGNKFRTTFYNGGTYGRRDDVDIPGEWPIGSGHEYLIDGNVFVGSEVLDNNGELQNIFSTVRGSGTGLAGAWSSGDTGPNGEWWTFLPLDGFANPNSSLIAMNKWVDSWPAFWPDKWDSDDPGWANDAVDGNSARAAWNGYFGKDNFTADEEAFFYADDYMNKEFQFFPDSIDTERRGLGIRMRVRSFQWKNALIEDGIFLLFDLENIGTYHHDKMIFAYKIGNNVGETASGGGSEYSDDSGAFDLETDLAYLWDSDHIGYGGWNEPGYFGGAFLESPGNADDGIDNDNDGFNGSGDVISEAMFAPRTLQEGEEVVVIDYETFERSKVTLTQDTLIVHYIDQTYEFWAGKVVEETPRNLVDDNLNGLIDESQGAEVGTGENAIQTYLYVGAKCINYFTDAGKDNLLLDERRDDGIDNDGDWSIEEDDVGADGKEFTGDTGEGDGLRTPGEPRFDQTDIDETDMLGLTSFTLYIWADMPHYEDALVWNNTIPGYLNDILQNDNIELLWGSGYFPMTPGATERFSMGLMAGEGTTPDDIIENKFWFAETYNQNYRFARAPDAPVLRAVAGDHRVTLYWDAVSEDSYDDFTGRNDFEGYRIYRSTDQGFNDMRDISDGKGIDTWRWPMAQFDLDDNYFGYSEVASKGVQFWLGTNTGLTHSFVDTTAMNGYQYFYAVTAYDFGAVDMGIAPSECAYFIALDKTGEVEAKSPNVQVVTPEAPSAGFEVARTGGMIKGETSTTDSEVDIRIAYPDEVTANDGHVYRITFNDTIDNGTPSTLSFNLMDVTENDTLLKESTLFYSSDELPIIDGFQLNFRNEIETLALNDSTTGWGESSDTLLYPVGVRAYSYSRGEKLLQAADFMVVFGEVGIGTSTEYQRGNDLLEAIDVNFKVINMSLNEESLFAFREQDFDVEGEGIFTGYQYGRQNRSDEIIILSDSLIAGWQIGLSISTEDTLNPTIGDTLFARFNKPFLSADSMEFTLHGQHIDQVAAEVQLDDIRVVPNPYIVSNSWEPKNPYSNGRGPRELHFINLPAECTIRIFNVRGQLVEMLEHQHGENLSNGTEVWDMLTKDNIDIAYGIYIYHVDAGKAGQKIGKFAVIK